MRSTRQRASSSVEGYYTGWHERPAEQTPHMQVFHARNRQSLGRQSATRPPQWLTVVFWLLLLHWTFVPTIRAYQVRIGPTPVDSRDIEMIVFALLVSVARLKTRRPSLPKVPDFGMRVGTALLVAYALVSLSWNGLDSRASASMAWTLFFMMFSVFVSCVLRVCRFCLVRVKEALFS